MIFNSKINNKLFTVLHSKLTRGIKINPIIRRTFSEQTIEVSGWKINYVKTGNGKHNILCMPGALGVWADMKLQIDGLSKDKFTIVAWDPPGYGKSRPPEKEFTLDFYEKDADVAFQFMKNLNIDKYSILGWSDGSISGMILAAKYPDVLKKLVIWGANARTLPTEIELFKKIRDISSWSPRMREPMIAIYGENLFAELWAKWTDIMIEMYEKKDGDICFDVLKDIKCDTLILHGEKDRMVDVTHAALLHTNIKNARLHLYPEGRHDLNIQFPEDFNKRVEEFLLV